MLELTVWQVILKQAATRDFPNYPVSHPVSVIANHLAGNTETGRHTGFPKIPCVTPCLGNSYDTVEYITAWKVIPKQAATWHIPKYPVSHPVSVIAMTQLNL